MVLRHPKIWCVCGGGVGESSGSRRMIKSFSFVSGLSLTLDLCNKKKNLASLLVLFLLFPLLLFILHLLFPFPSSLLFLLLLLWLPFLSPSIYFPLYKVSDVIQLALNVIWSPSWPHTPWVLRCQVYATMSGKQWFYLDVWLLIDFRPSLLFSLIPDPRRHRSLDAPWLWWKIQAWRLRTHARALTLPCFWTTTKTKPLSALGYPRHVQSILLPRKLPWTLSLHREQALISTFKANLEFRVHHFLQVASTPSRGEIRPAGNCRVHKSKIEKLQWVRKNQREFREGARKVTHQNKQKFVPILIGGHTWIWPRPSYTTNWTWERSLPRCLMLLGDIYIL